MSDTILLKLYFNHGKPSLEEAASKLGLHVEDLDQEFGVVSLDPEKRLYCVKAYLERLPLEFSVNQEEYPGPYSNPDIAPLGPVSSDAHNPFDGNSPYSQ